MNVEESWKIGDVEIPGKLILAPMAGVTDLPYRQICKEMGADLICTEMVSAKGIYYNSPNTQPLLEINPKERPVSLQLFGADPDIISEMAARIEELPFDILDINMGCPVPKVVNNGEGSALLKNIPLAEEIIRKTVRAIHKPVTVKFRKGFRDGECQAVDLAKAAEAAGSDALSLINTITGMKIDIHKRTFALANKTGGLSGPAIKPVAVRMVYQVAQAVKLPIIGMGGIANAEDAIEFMLAGATGVAVGAMNFVNPYTTQEVVKGIEDYMERYKVENLSELIGAVK